MSCSVDCYPAPREDMRDYAWIAERLAEFDRGAFGLVEDVQHVLVARRGSNRLGGCVTSCRFGWLNIERLWVDPEHRGNGVGSALLGTAEDLARERSLIGVRLVTTDRHTGLALYLRKGFAVDYRLRGHLADKSAIEEIGLSKALN